MRELVIFSLLGLGTGVLIAGLSLPIVISFRGSGIVDLSVGAVATLGAFLFYGLRTGGYLWLPPVFSLPDKVQLTSGAMAFVPALGITLALCAVFGVALQLLVYRHLRNAPPLAKLVASVGVLLTIQSILQLRFGTSGQFAPAILPDGPGSTLQVFGQGVPDDGIILAIAILVVALLLAGAYNRTSFGLRTRACAENDEHALLGGLNPGRVALYNVVLSSVLAGAVGAFIAPLTQLDTSTIALTVVPALAAALIARLSSFTIAAVAGLIMGLFESVLVYLQTLSWFPTSAGAPLPGVAEMLYFVLIVVALIWRGSSLPRRGTIVERRLPASPYPRQVMRPTLIISAAVIVGFLVLPFDFRLALIYTLIGFILCLSLVVIIGYVGQLSLVSLGLSGASAFALSLLSVHLKIGFPLGPIIAVAVAVVFGVGIGASALRIRGVTLGVVTLAAASALEYFGFGNPVWGEGGAGSPVSSPHLFGLNLGTAASFPINGSDVPTPVFGFVCAIAAIGAGLLVANLRRSRMGKTMLAVRSNESAAAVAGIDVRRVKLIAFAVSSGLAGLSGVLYAYALGQVTEPQFDVFTALAVVAFAYIGGITSMTGAVIGGLGITGGLLSLLAQNWIHISSQYQVIIGGFALLITVVKNPDGIAGLLHKNRFGPLTPILRRLGALDGKPSPKPAEGAGAP